MIVGNWKSNGDSEFIKTFSQTLNRLEFDSNNVEVLVAPTMLHLHKVNHALYSKVQVCSQNVSGYDDGAYTS